MAKIKTVSITDIQPNPHRMLGAYPYVEKKIDALSRSFDEVGMWEGVIARPADAGYELAFGHHRVEAARRAGMTKIDLIVRDDLDDELMLKFMGRENGEDYNADFLVMLETWEAAKSFLVSRQTADLKQHLEIAKLLGWVRNDTNGIVRLNDTAEACNQASKLIESGHHAREDFKELAVQTVRQIANATASKLAAIEKQATKAKTPVAEVEKVKKAAVRGGQKALEGIRSGEMSLKEAKHEPAMEMLRETATQRQPAMFDIAVSGVTKQVQKMLDGDSVDDKIGLIRDAMKDGGVILNVSDKAQIEELQFALGQLEKRAGNRKTSLDAGKVTKLKTI